MRAKIVSLLLIYCTKILIDQLNYQLSDQSINQSLHQKAGLFYNSRVLGQNLS